MKIFFIRLKGTLRKIIVIISKGLLNFSKKIMDKIKITTLITEIKQSPVTFFYALIFSGIICFSFISWMYKQRIENFSSQVAMLQTSSDILREQRDDYRSQSLQLENSTTTSAEKSNKQLKGSCFALFSNIRDLLSNYKIESDKISNEEFMKMAGAKNDTERNQIWSSYITLSNENSSKVMFDFEKKYKIDAIITRDEIQSRLPNKISTVDDLIYKIPTNPLGIGEIADDLELLCKSLP